MEKTNMTGLFEPIKIKEARMIFNEYVDKILDITDLIPAKLIYTDSRIDSENLYIKLKEATPETLMRPTKAEDNKIKKRREEIKTKLLTASNEEMKRGIKKIKSEPIKLEAQKTNGKNSVENAMIRFIHRKYEMLKTIELFTETLNGLEPDFREIIYLSCFTNASDTKIYMEMNLSERSYYRLKEKAICKFAQNIQIASLLMGAFIMPSNEEVAN